MAALQSINESNFQSEVLQSTIPVLVDFWAEWCGPCRAIAPTLEELAVHYKDKIKIVKLNVDENSAVASQYNIRSIPTLIFFKNGEPKETKIGALTKGQLTAFLDMYLST